MAQARRDRQGADFGGAGDLGQAELHDRVMELLEKRSAWYEQADLILDSETMDDDEVTAMIAGVVRSKGAYL